MSLTTNVFTNSSPVKNYLNNIGNFESGINQFTLMTVTLSNLIPTGAPSAGAASFTTFSATSASPIAGNYSLSAIGTAAFTAGQGFISPAVTIDVADRAKVLTGTFYYNVVSGTGNFSGSSSNTFAVYVYDTVNAAWIQPAGVYNLVQSSGVGNCTFTFQTASNTTSLQVAIVCINAPSTAMSMLFDNFQLGPQTAPMGPAMTDWSATQYPVTLGSGFGTPLYNALIAKREGDSLRVTGTIRGGTTNGTNAYLSLPSGLSIDYTKIGTGNTQLVGRWRLFNTASTSDYQADYAGNLFTDGSTTNQIFFSYTDSGTGSETKFSTNSIFGTNTWGGVEFLIPITGWSSNTAQSSDTDTRVVAAEMYSNTAVNPGGASLPLIFAGIAKDTHGSYNASTGQYKAPVTGFYNIFGALSTNSTGVYIYASINGDTTVTSPNSPYVGVIVSTGFGSISGQVYLLAGQTVDIRFGNSSATSVTGSWSIARVSGPAVVSATESVNASYTTLSSTTLTGGSPIVLTTKLYDSHGAYSTSTGLYTAPVSGKYRVSLTGTYTTGGSTAIAVYKNGSSYISLVCGCNANSNSCATVGVPLNAGDTVSFVPAATVTASATTTTFSFERIGN